MSAQITQSGLDNFSSRAMEPGLVKALRLPCRPAPARFGIAGISAGQDRSYKTHITTSGTGSREHEVARFARALGWLSIALGLTEILAAGPLTRWLGMPEQDSLVRAYGVRGTANGLGILAQDRPKLVGKWVQARVVGDVTDIATLATGLSYSNRRRGRVGVVLGIVAAVTVADVLCAALLTDR